eukprot:CAMPEP_0172724572 /NCGR_PEP_ID=MMETSP1074-20121228/86363_1 /TAXON_ID=2916 /ORGANISM="Ceratium fusus, Strain PA161109" /LENGTH=125 /DNA_ID=CAMNT_0013551087 /DNA_START=273 /DNA_END=650 /DNA_ORIENTATION=+
MKSCKDVRTWATNNKCSAGRYVSRWLPAANPNLNRLFFVQCVYKDKKCQVDAHKHNYDALCLPKDYYYGGNALQRFIYDSANVMDMVQCPDPNGEDTAASNIVEDPDIIDDFQKDPALKGTDGWQ